ncbi:MAG: bifunctional diaminohydroxyphosphoribosylaminopyrimidine deaminase/5-amino-6-(5-phosphoribosylamino)uracil reductase RibD [candidate division FCPU426 bacterium]
MALNQDEKFIYMAIDLARRGWGRTWPNPMVGAVVVKDGYILGQGWHRRWGGPHAEVYALRQAGRRAKDATLYLNLEPCSHFGKTPPCALAVIQARIKRVVCSMQDPNPKVSGKGFRLLRQAGIRVDVGLMKREAARLNEVFCKRITTGYPFVVNKAAISADGKIACANGESRWITGLTSRRYAHTLRALADAIVVGMGTVWEDDPRLTRRLSPAIPGRKLMRIILAGRRPVPADAAVLKKKSSCRTVVISAKRIHSDKLPKHVEVWHLPGRNGQADLKGMLRRLGEEGASYVLVEGGAEVHAGFLGCQHPGDEVLSDQVQFIYSPKIIGGRTSLGPVGGAGVENPAQAIALEKGEWRPLGQDRLFLAYPRKRQAQKPGGGD